MEVISGMEAVGFTDFQRLIEMVRHSKNANQTLQVLDKKCLTTNQMKVKARVKYRTRLILMFVEIYLSDGHDESAEKLLLNRMADPAYTNSHILMTYKAVLSVLRAISYMLDKREEREESPGCGVEAIARDPLLFSHIATDLGLGYKKKVLAGDRNITGNLFINFEIFLFITICRSACSVFASMLVFVFITMSFDALPIFSLTSTCKICTCQYVHVIIIVLNIMLFLH